MNNSGTFVISLDFELFWGVRDKRTISNYGDALESTHIVVPRMVYLFNKYNVKSTFATVGFLFAENKNEILQHSPKLKPNYKNMNLSPYNDGFAGVKEKNTEDPYHYASELISFLKKHPQHEIGTHTYSHFYCKEEGQTAEEFEADLKSAISIAKAKGVKLKSLVFPRNQVRKDYLKICEVYGIISYRGNESIWFCEPNSEEKTTLVKKIARTLDCYINISGHHCYDLKKMSLKRPFNIPSSRFLRPYIRKLKFFENLKIRRVKKAMTYSAKKGLLYHLWWHPHNYGRDLEDNFKTLTTILNHYCLLNEKYGYESKTMSDIADLFNSYNKKR